MDEFTLGNREKGRTTPVIRHRPSIYKWLGYYPLALTPMGIGRQLVACRQAQGLSQRDVARQLGLDPGTLSRTEQGRLGSTNRQVRRAIKALLGTSAVNARTTPEDGQAAP